MGRVSGGVATVSVMASDVVRRSPFGTNPVVGERGSDTRARVLAAAMEVFDDTAFSEARVEQITERAECSRPAFYQYFSSKDDVFWTLATQLGREMVELSDRLGPVTPDEAGLATLTGWMDDFMSLHEVWAPVFRAYPDATRANSDRDARPASIAGHTAQRLLEAFDLPPTAANRRIVGTLVSVLIRCSFYAEVAPAGISRRPLQLGLARLFHRVLGGPVEGVNFSRGRTAGRRRIKIVAPMEPLPPSGLRARGQRTRATLLRAGAEVLPSRGFHETRVDDIVEVAGVSHGTFYRYFDSKDDFFRALAEDASIRLVELIEQLDLDASGDELRRWLQEWFSAYEADGGVISTWQDMRSTPELVAFSQQIAAIVFSRLERLLDRRDFGHPQIASAMLLALLERAPYRVFVLGFSNSADEIDATLTIIRRGFLGTDD